MNLATTTGDFAKVHAKNEDRLQGLYDAGFRYADLSMYDGDQVGWAYMDADWETKTDSLRQKADSLGMQFVQAHSPGTRGNALLQNEHYDRLVDSTVRSIEICARLGIKNTVVHTGWCSDVKYNAEGKKVYFEENREFLQKLFPVMEKHNVNVLIENSTKANMGDMYYFFTGEDMNEFLAYMNHPLLGACWDTGHANCEGNQYEHIVTLGKNLKALHVNDNRSGRDEHMMPYAGSVNMDEIMCALLDINYDGYFTFECDSTLVNPGYWLGARKPFKRETRLADVPAELVLEAEKLLYKTGAYILRAYDCFEG